MKFSALISPPNSYLERCPFCSSELKSLFTWNGASRNYCEICDGKEVQTFLENMPKKEAKQERLAPKLFAIH